MLLLPAAEPTKAAGEIIVAGDGSAMLALPEGLHLPRLITDAGEKSDLAIYKFLHRRNRKTTIHAPLTFAPSNSSMFGARRKALDWSSSSRSSSRPYTKEMKETRHPQTVKQHLAALRMLFDNMVIGQIIPNNPATSVRGPKYSTKKRQDAGADGGRDAAAFQGDRHQPPGRPAGSSVNRSDGLHVRKGERRHPHEGRGLLPDGREVESAPPRKRREASRSLRAP